MFPRRARSPPDNPDNERNQSWRSQNDRTSNNRGGDRRGYGYNDRPSSSGRYNDRRDYGRNRDYGHQRGSSSRGAFESPNSLEAMETRRQRHNDQERIALLEKELKRRDEEAERDREAQSQRFGPHGDSSDDSSGGAPIITKNKKSKRHRHSSSSSSGGSRKGMKRDNDENDEYEFLVNSLTLQPVSYTQLEPSIKPTGYESFNPFASKKNRTPNTVALDAKVFTYQRDVPEHQFPGKEPTEVSPDVFQLEGAPFDIKNDASVNFGEQKEIDYEKMSYDEFFAMDILKRNAFTQSSAGKKARIFQYHLRTTTKVKDKIACYISLVNLEADLVEEQRALGTLTGNVNTNERKLGIIDRGIKECGDNVELRLMEIEILDSTKGVNSVEVKNAWEKLMNKFPNDLKMWRRRLTYYRNNRSIFNQSSYVKECLLPCLAKLGGIVNGTFKSHIKQEGTDEFLADVIVAAASFYLEFGATYKAIGIISALTEFYMLIPSDLENGDLRSKLKAFECFWESNRSKAGHIGARGWHRMKSNRDFTSYEFLENPFDAEEVATFDAKCESVIKANLEFCQSDRLLSNCERWGKVEKERTENFWEPIYDKKSKPKFYLQYNSFADVQPYLMNIPKDIVKTAIYKILIKLGAVFPDIKNFSQEAIFDRCGVVLYDEKFKMKYDGLETFVDKILLLLSNVDEELIVYLTVARLMTCAALTKKTCAKSDFMREFMKKVKVIYDSLIRGMNEYEKNVCTSFLAQVTLEIRFSDQNSSNEINEERYQKEQKDKENAAANIQNIFDSSIKAPNLLAYIRYYVMFCRDLPFYDPKMPDTFSKLKYLMKLTSRASNTEVDYLSKNAQKQAIQQWENIHLHDGDFDLPKGTNWFGNINAFAIELFATLRYETEDDPTLKFMEFKKLFTEKVMERNENLTEIYFKTWLRHFSFYHVEEKEQFMIQLKKYVEIFPRNDVLLKMLVDNLHPDLEEIKNFFLTNKSDDDVVKTLRSILEVGAEFENIRLQNQLTHEKISYKNIYDILEKAAKLGATSLIPESFLWRCLLYVTNYTSKTKIDDTFLVASDNCPWSKLLMTYAASIKSNPEFVIMIEEFAKKAEMTLFTSMSEIVDFA